MKRPAVTIMASAPNGSLYVGVTSDLVRRAFEHRGGLGGGFVSRHRCARLVYFENHAGMAEAIAGEKRIKAGPRHRKLALIETDNPIWRDFLDEIV